MAETPQEKTTLLLRAARSGDPQAKEALLRRYYPRVCRIVSLRLGKTLREFQHESDIVQETLLDMFQGMAHVKAETEGAFRHWLACTVENNIRDLRRKELTAKRGGGREQPVAAYDSSVLSESLYTAPDPSPSQVAMGREFEERLEQALLALDERSRRAIEMRHICGLSYEEISSELGLGTQSSARAVLHRAMSRLSSHL